MGGLNAFLIGSLPMFGRAPPSGWSSPEWRCYSTLRPTQFMKLSAACGRHSEGGTLVAHALLSLQVELPLGTPGFLGMSVWGLSPFRTGILTGHPHQARD